MHRYAVGIVVFALVAAIVLPGTVSSAPGGNGLADPGPGIDTVFTCNAKAPKFDAIADSGTGKSTSSTTFVDVPNTTIAVDVGGSADSCAKVEFSAYAFAATGSALMLVQVRSDGFVCWPGEVQFSGDDDENGNGQWARSHAFNFLCNTSPGVHTFKAQFRSSTGGLVFIHRTSLFVNHR